MSALVLQQSAESYTERPFRPGCSSFRFARGLLPESVPCSDRRWSPERAGRRPDSGALRSHFSRADRRNVCLIRQGTLGKRQLKQVRRRRPRSRGGPTKRTVTIAATSSNIARPPSHHALWREQPACQGRMALAKLKALTVETLDGTEIVRAVCVAQAAMETTAPRNFGEGGDEGARLASPDLTHLGSDDDQVGALPDRDRCQYLSGRRVYD